MMNQTLQEVPSLAYDGGDRAVPRGATIPAWPQVTDHDRELVLDALDSGRFTTAASGEQHIPALEQEWAAAVGVAFCVATSNGTTALSLALGAGGVGPGDEVIVPALSFVATGLAPVHLGAYPVFVDVDPTSFNAVPQAIEAAITERTRAIVLVHLHGLPADADRIRELADRRGLLLVEDAAQAHGATLNGRPVGGFGHINAFSLNVSKNLATCGEGGLVTTDDPDLFQRALMLRQFGELIPHRGKRSYVSHLPGWNLKPSALNCAFTRGQLSRFAEVDAVRRANVETFLDRLSALSGLIPPTRPDDRTHAWHILRFAVDAAGLELPPESAGALRQVLMSLLVKEGVPASTYQSLPLPSQPALVPLVPEGARFPSTEQVLDRTFTIQKAHLHPDAAGLLDRYAAAFEKVWDHPGRIRELASEATPTHRPPWAVAAKLAAREYPPSASLFDPREE
jgi:perosamine synthetase